MAPVDPAAEWWTTSDVAEYLGLRIGTVSSYRQRGQMPPPDRTFGRTHLWHPRTITDWQGRRPRVGDARAEAAPPAAKAVAAAASSGSVYDTRWIVHGERTIYDNPWVTLSLADVGLPDGQRLEHHVVTMSPTAMTALLDDAGEHVLLMWRHRFASDVWNWELPGGLLEEGEDPAVTAAREVEEETGYRPRSLEHVVTFEPAIGMVRNLHHVYVGHGAERIGEPSETTEMERMEWVPLGDVLGLVDEGKILNSGTLVALLYVLASRAEDAS
jgi:8-oxo-dGTP pyrophosphatase MutT (NUDIX family)